MIKNLISSIPNSVPRRISNHNVYSLSLKSMLYTSNSNQVNKEWTKTLNNAEKVVGYPTSFLNLRYLVSDEVANFANLLRKLMKTKHPLINMARKLISYGENEPKRSLQINGLLVLLIAKAAGIPKKNRFLDVEISDGIHSSQRCLAEISEMIYMGSMIHKGILDLNKNQNEFNELEQGNKLAVLCGDYLLANACTNLAKLKNTQVVFLMSQVIADISQGIFDEDPSSKITFLKKWYENINSKSSSLVSNSAKSAMLLVSHQPDLQEIAWNFAFHLDITHKIWSDLYHFKQDESILSNPDSILNAVYRDKYELKSPINQEKKSFISNWFDYSKKSIDNNLILNELFEDCKLIFQKHYKIAWTNLDQLENEYSQKDAILSLRSILSVMKSTV
ncbi:decaprenyl-diphosphate synthase subunit 2 [Brachionus plicatilis]|uniref:Decaprenyl-diphosphate synthase subunit 2 n=1 Tax=Brachionus plicatilis TaxID=10195 RepID=A0A3M7R0S7_BRAPC|nr:decaprenyl-diphosphate synthase subunit 2 [Brachionus plicatilis]